MVSGCIRLTSMGSTGVVTNSYSVGAGDIGHCGAARCAFGGAGHGGGVGIPTDVALDDRRSDPGVLGTRDGV